MKALYARIHIKAKPSDIRRLRKIDMSDCFSIQEYVSGRSRTTRALADLAKDTASSTFLLQNTAYPSRVWQDYVNMNERDQLEKIGRGDTSYKSEVFIEGLLERLEQYRQRDTTVPVVVWDTECGGHGKDIKIRIVPDGAEVFRISRWMKEYCRALGVDSDDEKKCHEWTRVEPGDDLMNGDRVYKGVWSNAVGFRVLNYNEVKEGTTYVIRPSR